MQEEVIKKLKNRIEKLKEKENVAVVYHFDVDGCAAASLLWRYFQKHNITSKFFPATRGFEAVTTERISKFAPDKIILVDYIPGDELIRFIRNYDAEFIDHHVHEEHLEIFDYYTTADDSFSAAISYSLTKAMEELDINNINWLGKVGSFWDKTLELTDEYYDGIYEKEIEDMLPFNLVVNLSHTKGSERLFEVFNMSSSFEEAIEKIKDTDDYHRASEIFKKEYREIEFSRKEYPNLQLSIYWVRTQFKHIRIYVDYISYLKKGTKIFVLDENIRFKFSFRTSLDINLIDIIREMHLENDKFSGGGHPQACGAMLNGENVEEIISLFIDKYKKNLDS
jgi:single-stranded DNA-specific DHH superfamily exonuclease